MKTYEHKPSAATQTSLPFIVIHLFELTQLFLLVWSAVHITEEKWHACDVFAHRQCNAWKISEKVMKNSNIVLMVW